MMRRWQSQVLQQHGVHFLVAVFLMGAGAAVAQDVDLEQYIVARSISSLVEIEGQVFGGLDNGGIAALTGPGTFERWTSGDQLSGNQVTDLAWTGRYLWVATLGSGMTRVTDPTGQPEFRQYASNLGGLRVTAVTGAIIGSSERVYYGMDGQGVGLITDGLSGAVYTAEQDGLISNEVTCLQLVGSELFVGTPVGISRFANNLFTDQNAGLGSLVVNDLTLDENGSLLAATNSGISRWDPGTETWSTIGSFGTWMVQVSAASGQIFALGIDSQSVSLLHRYAQGSWEPLPLPFSRTKSVHVATQVWIGGEAVHSSNGGALRNGYIGQLRSDNGFDTFEMDASQVLSSEGIAFGADDRAWMGSWFGSAISATDGTDWENIYERAGADNDSSGLAPFGGNILSMAADDDRLVYAGQYAVGGVLRHDPDTGQTKLMEPNNCGLLGKGIVNLVTHPDGALIVMHDWSSPAKVEVLFDPENWRGDANWVALPNDGGLGPAVTVWDAAVERPDVVWFAVPDVGLVRWDINGDGAGPDDPLTWKDQSDDRWDPPVTDLVGTNLDPTQAFGLAVASDGSIWAGGNGLVQFTYDSVSRSATLLTSVAEKTGTFVEGLINANVSDIAIDVNGDVWVASATGLNRVQGTGTELKIQAWMDLANYFSNPQYGVLYSPNVISAMPGTLYRKITADGTGKHLLLSANLGSTLITVAPKGSGGEASLASAYCYPNPFLPADSPDGLKIAGLQAEVTSDQPATVEIYGLTGQLVYRNKFVVPETGFWQGANRNNQPVTSGMYTVKISWGDLNTVVPLAVVR